MPDNHIDATPRQLTAALALRLDRKEVHAINQASVGEALP